MLIAVVEDNKGMAEAISTVLVDAGHGVDILNNGYDAEEYLKKSSANLVILDLGLPGKNGLDILRSLRASGDATPVLILTALSETEDTVVGLNAGADDYLGKPFEMSELLARVNALLRRNIPETLSEVYGGLEFDRQSRTLVADGQLLDVPRKELAVFECLASNSGRLVSKETLLNFVYGTGADTTEAAIEVYVSRLRKRIEPFGIKITAARGIGYRLEC
jgi:two-component system OmpR family response regulator